MLKMPRLLMMLVSPLVGVIPPLRSSCEPYYSYYSHQFLGNVCSVGSPSYLSPNMVYFGWIFVGLVTVGFIGLVIGRRIHHK
jgi:hypothetical protein